jgi:hypothetical protein
MEYDYRSHRYILTEDHVLEAMNIDLRSILNTSMSADVANAVSRLLDRVSRIVYSFVYRVVAFRFATEKVLALDEGARTFIQTAMEEQLVYMLQNGDISALSGVNVQAGTAVDKKTMRSAEIAPLSEDALISSGYVRAVIPRGEKDIEPHYEEEGY